jgi:hypothetical protein
VGVPIADAPAPDSDATPALAAVFGLSVVAVLARFAVTSLGNPNGWWDAWMIYNLRARFLLRSGAHWADAFSALLPLSHPDYPLLVPALVARSWSYLGRETTIVPQLVALVYMLGTVGLLWAALALLRDQDQALIAGTVLVAAPLFSDTAVVQDADTPLGFYFLTTMVLLAFDDRQISAGEPAGGFVVLAGLSAGLAAWTKNEGLLFILVLVALRFVMRSGGEHWRLQARSAAMFGLGLLPVLAVLLYFKLEFAPTNDLVASQGLRESSERLLDLRRYGTIVTNLRDIIENDGPMGVVSAVWVLAIHAVCVGFDPDHRSRTAARTALVTAGMMLAGYVTVYLTSPYDLQSHIDSSLTRLLAQVWPTALFGYFLVARTPREART